MFVTEHTWLGDATHIMDDGWAAKYNCLSERDIEAVKKFLITALVLGLVVACPNPLSLCALPFSAPGDSGSAETRSHCDKMDMGEHSGQTVTSRSNSCCAVSQAPLPKPKTELSKTTVKLELAVALTPATNVVNSERVRARSVPHEASPPPLRSLLCTFLI